MVVQVPTGNTYTQFYYDNGVRKSREVEYIRQELKVQRKPVGERRTWAEVEEVINQGKPAEVIEKFITCALEVERQAFFNEYIQWFAHSVVIDEWAASVEQARDEDGQFISDNPETPEDEAWVGGKSPETILATKLPEPVPNYTDPTVYRVKHVKRLRDTGRYDVIEVAGRVYDADPQSYMNLTGTLESWTRLVADQSLIDAGIVKDGKMLWTLQDNSNVFLSKTQLQLVVDSIRVRAGVLHAQYQAAKFHS